MVARMCELNPRLEAVEIPDAGHYIHDDQLERFAQVVTAFLKRADTTDQELAP